MSATLTVETRIKLIAACELYKLIAIIILVGDASFSTSRPRTDQKERKERRTSSGCWWSRGRRDDSEEQQRKAAA